ncbi:MAG: hypothetical protein NTW73_00045, partial [Candidatus Parcubacteria bacterium]|nr:hypothetical protein [Candidatus Parcubacteria bacterium]
PIWQTEITGENCQLIFGDNQYILNNCRDKNNSNRIYYRLSLEGKILEQFSINDQGEDKTLIEYQNNYLIVKQITDTNTNLKIYTTQPVNLFYNKTFPTNPIVCFSNEKTAILADNIITILNNGEITKQSIEKYNFDNPQYCSWSNDNITFKKEKAILVFNETTKKIELSDNTKNVNTYMSLTDGSILITDDHKSIEKVDLQGKLIKQAILPFTLSNLESYEGNFYAFLKSYQDKKESLVQIYDKDLNLIKTISWQKDISSHLYDAQSHMLMLKDDTDKQLSGYHLEQNQTIWDCSQYYLGNFLGLSNYTYLFFPTNESNTNTEKILAIDPSTGKTIESYIFTYSDKNSSKLNWMIKDGKPEAYRLSPSGNKTIVEWFQPISP